MNIFGIDLKSMTFVGPSNKALQFEQTMLTDSAEYVLKFLTDMTSYVDVNLERL